MAALSTQVVRALLKDGWKQQRPIYAGLAESLRTAVATGEISPGDRLPAERDLALVLQVSRSTIVGAYDVLRTEGWLVSRTGSGTFAADRRPGVSALRLRDMVDGSRDQAKPPVVRAPGGRGRLTPIDLTISRPHPFNTEIREAILHSADALPEVVEHLEYAVQGLPQLRELIAASFTARGLPTTASQILVTSGAQQALGLLTQLFVAPDDVAIVETPTYLGAIDALRERRAQLVSLPASDSPLDVAGAVAVARRRPPALMFVMPTCHTVTGAILDADERAALAALSLDLQMPLIEDDIFAGLTFEPEVAPPIGAFAEDAPIFTVGSMSKLYWNGLRVGWLRAPEAMVVRLARLKGSVDLGTSLIAQLVAQRLLEPERLEAALQTRLAETRDGLELVQRLLRRKLPDWSWVLPRGGRSLWCKLPTDGATQLAYDAARLGVTVLPGPQLCPDGTGDDHVRLMYVQRPSVLDSGIDRLVRAWRQQSGHRR